MLTRSSTRLSILCSENSCKHPEWDGEAGVHGREGLSFRPSPTSVAHSRKKSQLVVCLEMSPWKKKKRDESMAF